MKKFLNIVLIGLLLVSMTGCNSNKEYSDNSTSNTNKNDTKIYYCKETNDDDYGLFFHYKNEKLVSLDVNYWLDEEVLEEAKDLAKEYKNVTYNKTEGESSSGEIFDRISLTIDFTKKGMTLQETFDMFEGTTDTSWENIEKIVKNNSYTCSLEN